MAEIGSITQAAYYRGDVALGGGTVGAFQLDTKPLEDLGKYTMLYNKSEREAEQKKAEAAAKEIADMSQYDLSSAIPKDRDHLQARWQEMFDLVKNDPSVLDYPKNKQGWLEYQKKKSDLANDIAGAKVRSTLYTTRMKEVDAETDADVKKIWKENLDKEASDTDIRQPLRHTAQFDVTPVAVPKAPMKKFDVTDIGYNYLGKRTHTMWDMRQVNALAASASLGLDQLLENKGSSDPLLKQQYAMQKASGKLEPVESANNFNAAIQPFKENTQYQNEDGTVKWEEVTKNSSGLVRDVLTQVEAFNNQMRETKNLIRSGYFKDDLGKQLSFGGKGGVNESDYKEINLSDGLQSDEIMKMRIMAKSDSESFDTDVKYTGAGTKQQHENNLDRHNKAMEGIGWHKARTAAKLAARKLAGKTPEQVDASIKDDWKRNMTNNTSLVTGGGGTNIKFQLPHKDEHPFLRIAPDGKTVEQVLPQGAKITYDSYKVDIDENTHRAVRVKDEQGRYIPAKGAKIIDVQGGHYDQRYFKGGKPVEHQEINSDYQTFKKNYKSAYGSDFAGGLNDYLKLSIDQELYDVEVIGAGGKRVNQDDYRKALMLINNQSKTGKETGVQETGTQFEDQQDIASEEEDDSTD